MRLELENGEDLPEPYIDIGRYEQRPCIGDMFVLGEDERCFTVTRIVWKKWGMFHIPTLLLREVT